MLHEHTCAHTIILSNYYISFKNSYSPFLYFKSVHIAAALQSTLQACCFKEMTISHLPFSLSYMDQTDKYYSINHVKHRVEKYCTSVKVNFICIIQFQMTLT